MNPTDEQIAILDATTGTDDNLMCNAFAGTGKTTMLELIEKATKTRPILYLCFNAKIAESARKKMQSTTTVRTFNSMGHRIWAQSCGKNLSLDNKKTANILRSFIDEVPRKEQGEIWDVFWDVVHGVGLAKALGYVPDNKFPNAKRLIDRAAFHARLDEEPDDLTADLIDAILVRSIKAAYAGSIDYNDQVYMPAVFGGTFPRFPLVLIDEAQDLNPVNHALLDKLARVRSIFVGDRYQSIYGFRGAVQSGMETLATKFQTTPFDLSISFRCPRAIVENARWRVPQFKWIKEGGHVETLETLIGTDFASEATILCRNNAPLFAVALRLLGVGRSVNVSGSDIGPKLIALMKKLGPENLSREQTLGAIAQWRHEKVSKDSKTANDMADCMAVFAEHGTDLGQAIRYAEHVLKQSTGSVRLMTGHKAKGLEFPIVYHLDQFLCREDEQDLNLRYVIQTRSMNQYYEINSGDIAWA